MKKYIFLSVLVICVSVFIYFGGDREERPAKPIMRIGMECDYAPNNWEEKKPSQYNAPLSNQEGSYADGYDLQIARLVAESLDATLEVRKVAWDDLIPALLRGEIDAIFSGMLDTEERRQRISFTEPYEAKKTEYVVVVNNKSKYVNAKTFEDLKGARLVAQKDTKLNDAIDQIPGVVHMAPVATVAIMLDHLINFRVDGIVINLDTGQSYERTYTNLTLIRFPEDKGFKLGFSGICAGVRKSDEKFLDELNTAIKTITIRDRQRIMDRAVSRLWEDL